MFDEVIVADAYESQRRVLDPASGRELWRLAPGYAELFATRRLLIVRSTLEGVQAFDARTGELRWSRKLSRQ